MRGISAWQASATLEQAERMDREQEGRNASSGDHQGSNQNPHNFEAGHWNYSGAVPG